MMHPYHPLAFALPVRWVPDVKKIRIEANKQLPDRFFNLEMKDRVVFYTFVNKATKSEPVGGGGQALQHLRKQ